MAPPHKLSLPLPEMVSLVLHLHPPGSGAVDGLAVDAQPGAHAPEPLLEHRGDHAVGGGPHVQEVVPSHGHRADQVLRAEEGRGVTPVSLKRRHIMPPGVSVCV